MFLQVMARDGLGLYKVRNIRTKSVPDPVRDERALRTAVQLAMGVPFGFVQEVGGKGRVFYRKARP